MIEITSLIQPIITLVASFGGALAGAALAFKLNAAAKAKERIDAQVSAVNKAIFTLSMQQNTLVNLKEQALDKQKGETNRHFMRAVMPLQSLQRIDADSLIFLVTTPYASTMMDVIFSDRWFESIAETIKDRYRVHHDEVQPIMEKVMQELGGTVPLAEMEKRVGLRLTKELKQLTDALYDRIEKYDARYARIAVRFSQEMKQLFPEHNFLAYSFPESAPASSKNTI